MISSFSTLGSMKKNTAVSIPPVSVSLPNTRMPVVIIGTGSTNRFGYSSDLTTWSYGTLGSITNPSSICCGNVNSSPLWVVIGKDNGTTYYSTTSTNGTTWTTPNSSISAIFTSSGWLYNSLNFGYDKDGNGIFLAAGYGGTSGSPSVAISNDGLNWVVGGYPFTTTRFANNCYYGNGYWVVVGNSGTSTDGIMYSTNVSVSGNASISWSNTGRSFLDPAYGVVYSGNRWLIGTLNNAGGSTNGNLYVSSSSNPTSTYTSSRSVNQYPSAIMATQGNAVVGGSGSNNNYLFYFNPVTTTTPAGALSAATAPSRTWQIEYVTTTTMWIAVMGGTSGQNNSIAYSTDSQRQTNPGQQWNNISSVNTNIPSCVGIAASR